MLADVPSGVAVTRLGDKVTMAGGALTVALACAGFAFAADPWTLGLLALALGAGFGALMLGRLSYVTRRCPAAYRGRAITALAGIQRLGLFVGPPAGGLVAEGFGFAGAFAAAAILNVAGLVLIGVFVRRSRPGARGGAQPHRAVIARILREHRHEFIRGGLASVAMQFVRSARQVLIPLWGGAIGLDPASIGLAFGLSSALDAAMFYPAGWLMDVRGRKWTLVPSLALLGASLVLMPFATTFLALSRGRSPLRARERLRHRDHHGPRGGPLAAHPPRGVPRGLAPPRGRGPRGRPLLLQRGDRLLRPRRVARTGRGGRLRGSCACRVAGAGDPPPPTGAAAAPAFRASGASRTGLAARCRPAIRPFVTRKAVAVLSV